MRTDHWYDSCGKGQIHYCRWMPEGEIKGILQIIHGIAEFVERYDDFANYLNAQGYLVVADVDVVVEAYQGVFLLPDGPDGFP